MTLMDNGIGIVTPTSLCLPFPLRPDFLAKIIVPIDMTREEAERLAAFVRSMAWSVP